MNFNKHSHLTGTHSFLSASQCSWLGYEEQDLVDAYKRFFAAQYGTRLHAFAAEAIQLGQKLPKINKTLNMYVNDAIGYKMTPEQVLYFSDNCYGTADAISFRGNSLRIHDLKTGTTPARIEQLEVYAALFCLEYKKKPNEIEMELRIYQNDDMLVFNPTAIEIAPIMDKIISFDKLLNKLKEEEQL